MNYTRGLEYLFNKFELSKIDFSMLVGVSRTTLYDWYNNKRRISDKHMKCLQDIFDISENFFNEKDLDGIYGKHMESIRLHIRFRLLIQNGRLQSKEEVDSNGIKLIVHDNNPLTGYRRKTLTVPNYSDKSYWKKECNKYRNDILNFLYDECFDKGDDINLLKRVKEVLDDTKEKK